MPRIEVYPLPTDVVPEALTGATAIVIDVLRATTTMIHALAAGAKEIVVCAEVEEAHAAATAFQRNQFVLGGERGGVRIAGFDLGNSPADYTAKTVGGKTVIFTTTNGTRALLHCRAARRVLVAGFVNLSAICEAVRGDDRVAIVCAGTRGDVTGEDVLLAGAIVHHFAQAADPTPLNAAAQSARDAWLSAGPPATDDDLVPWLRDSQGGHDLIALGLDADIADATRRDRFRTLPVFHPQSRRVSAGIS